MNREKAMKQLVDYLRYYNLTYYEDIAGGTPRITVAFGHADNCPGGVLEGCVYFFKDGMEVRVYYSEVAAEWCRKSDHVDGLYRLLNYINANVWIKVQDDGMGGSLYNSVYLYSPRFYMTEDGQHDITATFLVSYESVGVQALATWDFFTAALPELMNDISPAIFMLLLGKVDVNEAISMIDKAISSQG